MPEISNYTFDLRELTELLVKASGVRGASFLNRRLWR